MKVGVMVGREESFPESIIKFVNENGSGVEAEMVTMGGVRAEDLSRYSVIIDRISHDVPFYRTALKQAVLDGTTVLVNPFWFAADDKHFGTALAHRIGVAVPKTVLLPQKEYNEDISSGSLRNLAYPLDWQGILDYVGLPAIMKPSDGGGWRDVNKIESMDDLLHHFDRSGNQAMMLQEFIKWDRYIRAYCVGRKDVLVMGYDPAPYLQGKYFKIEGYVDDELHERIVRDTVAVTKSLGYEINACEWAIRDGIPYAIDFMNPVCDAERSSVGEEHHDWFVKTVGELALKYAKTPPEKPSYHWADVISHPPAGS